MVLTWLSDFLSGLLSFIYHELGSTWKKLLRCSSFYTKKTQKITFIYSWISEGVPSAQTSRDPYLTSIAKQFENSKFFYFCSSGTSDKTTRNADENMYFVWQQSSVKPLIPLFRKIASMNTVTHIKWTVWLVQAV